MHNLIRGCPKKRIRKITLKGLLKREIKRPGLTFGQLGPEDHSIMYIYEQNFNEDRNAPITAYQRATISDT